MKCFNLSTKIFTSFCFVFFFAALVKVNAYPPIFRPNWANSMGQSWSEASSACIELGSDNRLYIGMTIYSAIQTVSTYSPMAVRYTMTVGGQTFASGITSTYSQFTAVTIDGHNIYEQKFTIPISCAIKCDDHPGAHFYADFTFEVVYGSVAAPSLYPAGLHNGNIWPWSIFQDITGTGYTEIKYMQKEICCYSPLPIISVNEGTVAQYDELQLEPLTVEPHGSQDGTNASLGTTAQAKASPRHLVVTPNPFSSKLQVRFEVAEPSEVGFECFDLHGRTLQNIKEQYGVEGIYERELDLGDLPPGVYYLRVSTSTSSQTHKIIKAGN